MQIETGLQAAGEQPIVFVIEHEQVVRSALHFILRDRYRAFAFASFDEALAAVTDTPNVVLLARSFLQDERDVLPAALAGRFGGAAILVVVDSGGDALARLSIEHGAHGIISKPISFDTVCDAVDRVLGASIALGAAPRLVRMSFG